MMSPTCDHDMLWRICRLAADIEKLMYSKNHTLHIFSHDMNVSVFCYGCMLKEYPRGQVVAE